MPINPNLRSDPDFMKKQVDFEKKYITRKEYDYVFSRYKIGEQRQAAVLLGMTVGCLFAFVFDYTFRDVPLNPSVREVIVAGLVLITAYCMKRGGLENLDDELDGDS